LSEEKSFPTPAKDPHVAKNHANVCRNCGGSCAMSELVVDAKLKTES
jgi:hypothetical protein